MEHLLTLLQANDGILPDLVRLEYGTAEGLAQAYNKLCYLIGAPKPDSTIYLVESSETVLLQGVENPVLAVASGRAESFLTWLQDEGLTTESAPIDIGVFVFPEELDIIFAPGPSWTTGSLERLVRAIRAVTEIDGFDSTHPIHSEADPIWLLFMKCLEESV